MSSARVWRAAARQDLARAEWESYRGHVRQLLGQGRMPVLAMQCLIRQTARMRKCSEWTAYRELQDRVQVHAASTMLANVKGLPLHKADRYLYPTTLPAELCHAVEADGLRIAGGWRTP